MKAFILLVIGYIVSLNSFAQSCFSVNSPVLPCGTNCATLTVVPCIAGLGYTSSYTVSSIPYTPYSYTGGTAAIGVGQDDIWSSLINLPFYFCFFGNSYNRVTVGANGQLSFDASRAGTFDDWVINNGTGLPNAPNTPSTVRNCILGPYHDLDPGIGGTFHYATYGTAPNRVFTASWNLVPLYSCTAQKATQQIVLYEGTNNIDINIANKPLCASWNGGWGITGICNSTGTLFYTPPGENGPQFTATNESWRFTAAGSVTPWSYTWTAPGGVVISTNDTVTVCPSVTTVYTVSATSASCNNLTVVLTATVTPGGASSPISGPVTACAGSTIVFSDSTLGGTWSSSNTSVATIDVNTGAGTAIASGTSVITYTFPAGCIATATLNVISSLSPITGPVNVCTGKTITLSNAVAGGTWSGSPPGIATINPATRIVAGVSPGAFIITYTTGCGSSTYTVTVDQSPFISGAGMVCSGSSLVLSSSVSGGTWASVNTGVATVSNTGVVSGVAASGSTTISYTSPAGCIAAATVTVSSPPDISANVTGICTNGTTALSVSPTGGTWSNSNTSVATINPNTRIVRGLSGGTAILTYTNSCGSDTITITVSALSNITGPSAVCIGSTIGLSNATPGGTWSSSNIGRATVSGTGMVTGISAGPVLITYMLPGGCFDTASVAVNTQPVITAPSNICVGAVAVLSGTPSGGTWICANTTIATVTAAGGNMTGVSAGPAVITYTYGSCAATATVTIDAATYTGAGSISLCAGNTTALSNATAGGTWNSSNVAWATVTSSGMVTGIAAGTAIISYTTNACSIYTTTVTVNAAPSVSGPGVICMSNPVGLSVSPGGGTWSSSNPGIATVTVGNIVTPVSVGTVILTYFVGGGCFYSKTVNVLSSVPGITGATHICTGQSVKLSDAATGGTWSASPGSIATINAGSGVATGMAAGVVNITYSIGSGCMTTTTLMVYATPNAGIISGASLLCVGGTTTLSASVGGGTWVSSGTAGSFPGGVVTAIAAGTMTIKYIVSNGNCSDTATKLISILNVPNAGVISGIASLCTGSSVTLSETVAGGVWSISNTSVATVSAGGVVTGMTSGTDTVRYTVNNGACTATATYVITVSTSPDAGVISGQAVVCVGVVYTLNETVAGGVWSSSDTSVATVDSVSGHVHALSGGVTVITYTIGGSGSCVGVATFTITVTTSGTFTIGSVVTPVLCHGDSSGSIVVTVTGGTPPYSYVWSTTDTTAGIYNLAPGVYILNVKEATTQCIAGASFTVSEPDSLYVTDSMLQDACLMGTGAIYTQVHGGVSPYSYHWSNGATTSSIENLHSGTYSVTVTDVNNCMTILLSAVTDSTCSAVKVHNAVTPNGDGVNDTWVIEGIEGYATSTVQVFDKWGDKVFEQTNYKNDWGCRGRSGTLPDGTYYYLIKLNAANVTGGDNTFTGSLLIKR